MKKLLITMVALMACSTATFAQWYVNKKTNGMIHVTKTKSFQQMAQKGSCEIVKFDQGGSSEKITGAGLTEQFPVEAAPGQTVKRTMHANYRGKKATFYKCRLNTCNGYKRENNSQVYK